MFLKITNFLKSYFIKKKTKIKVDREFYDDDFFLIDLEVFTDD